MYYDPPIEPPGASEIAQSEDEQFRQEARELGLTPSELASLQQAIAKDEQEEKPDAR